MAAATNCSLEMVRDVTEKAGGNLMIRDLQAQII